MSKQIKNKPSCRSVVKAVTKLNNIPNLGHRRERAYRILDDRAATQIMYDVYSLL